MTKSELEIKLREWEKELKLNELAKKTINGYSSDIKGLLEFIPSDDDEVTKDVLINYKEKMKNEKKSSSINRAIISINKFFAFCGQDMSLKNVRIQKQNTFDNLLTQKELKGILNQAEKQNEYQIYYIVKTLVLTGVRYSELKYVTIEACRDKKITIENKGKIRNIPLEADLAKELIAFAKTRDITGGMIFITKNGTFIKNEQFSRKLKKVVGKAHFIALKKAHAHNFRHLFAVNLLETVNNNMAEVADILGHSSLETTRIYLRNTTNEKRSHIKEMKNKLGI